MDERKCDADMAFKCFALIQICQAGSMAPGANIISKSKGLHPQMVKQTWKMFFSKNDRSKSLLMLTRVKVRTRTHFPL